MQMTILPRLGGSVASLTYKGRDILRPMKEGSQNPADAALFVMLPYCGRIRNGAFSYWGIIRKVPKTHPDFKDPIHGDGWVGAWRVAEQTDARLALEYAHDKTKGFPFDYAATLTYTLTDAGWDMEITIRNPSPLPMPCAMGVHPFFPKTKDVVLDFNSRVVWVNENDPIFDKPYPTPNEWDFGGGKVLKDAFNTVFGGFEQSAKIIYPDRDTLIEITTDDGFRHITLFAPKGKDFFCLEPWSATADAFNLAAAGVIGTGIRSIGPGQSISGRVSFKIKG